jgi:glutamyl-tRNA synthetase
VFESRVPSIRTRFAPSPTGYLHLGGARTALFNYLFARRHGGKFVLRIEDTDRERSRPEYVDAILESLQWLALEHDEGPFYQSRRGEIYDRRVKELLAAGCAYWCYCSADEVEAKRQKATAEGRKPVYDRTCRDLGRQPRAGESAVVRFKSPLAGTTVVEDMVRGAVAFENAELDDFVIVRSDGSPTFHLVVVVDDAEMGITHILRGEDHLTNTPRQMGIFKALGVEPPRYGHLPLIVGVDRARLSKRHGATAVGSYRELGFLPEAVVNYLARLGWSHGDSEILMRGELVSLFDIEGIGRSAAAFDLEKFTWVNAQHLKAKDDAQLAVLVRPFLDASGAADVPAEQLARICGLLKERARTLAELAEQASYLVSDHVRYDAAAVGKFLSGEQLVHLRALADELAAVEPWTVERIEAVFRALVERLGTKLGKLAQPTRVALTGGTASPGIFEVCEVLGRQRTVERIRSACTGAEQGLLAATPSA